MSKLNDAYDLLTEAEGFMNLLSYASSDLTREQCNAFGHGLNVVHMRLQDVKTMLRDMQDAGKPGSAA
jgi:hypothetical protein